MVRILRMLGLPGSVHMCVLTACHTMCTQNGHMLMWWRQLCSVNAWPRQTVPKEAAAPSPQQGCALPSPYPSAAALSRWVRMAIRKRLPLEKLYLLFLNSGYEVKTRLLSQIYQKLYKMAGESTTIVITMNMFY